jgi:hypothetical protein
MGEIGCGIDRSRDWVDVICHVYPGWYYPGRVVTWCSGRKVTRMVMYLTSNRVSRVYDLPSTNLLFASHQIDPSYGVRRRVSGE